jgi:subtilisin family serine protease
MKLANSFPRIFFVFAILSAFATLWGSTNEATAEMLVGTLGQGGTPSTLVVVDPTTGGLTPIGPVGYAVNGMDWYNGTLYGITSVHDTSYHGLIQIDLTTGAGTPIGSGWGSITTETIAEMAIDSSGRAFGWGEPSEDDLYEINLATGTASRVGESGLGTAQLGIAFDLADDLYLINTGGDTYNINPDTGASFFLGNIIGGSCAHHGDVSPSTGIYYGLSSQSESFSDLLAVNLNTLTVLSTVRTDQKVHTLAFVLSSPDDLAVTPSEGFVSSGDEGGPFTPASKNYTLTNNGPNLLDWTAETTAAWLTVSPAAASLAAGESIDVEVSLNASANSLPQGIYNDNVTFTNTNSGFSQTRGVQLTVNVPPPPPPQPANPDPCDGATNVPVYKVLTWNNGVANATVRQDVEPGVRSGVESHSVKETGTPNGTFIDAKGQGGPDPCGYTFIDSDEPGGPSFNWIEISGTGTNLNLSDDTYFFPINLPFNFNFYDTDYTQVAVGSNGAVYFMNQYMTLSNVCIPGSNDSGIQQFIALYWDDLYPSGANNVYYKIVGSAPNRILVVQWQNVSHYGSSGDAVTVQAQLLENSDILLLYANPSSEAGAEATVGIQNDVSTGLEYLCNQASLHSGLAILFTRGGGALYDVYFDTANPPVTLIHSGLTAAHCEPVPYPLAQETTYYWQVIATNPGGQTAGPVWSFTTVGPPGEIEVTDSIPEPNDLNMPFGNVIVGLSRTEHITITNTDPTYGLIVTDISLNGGLITSSTSELSVALPAVSNGSSGSYGSYLPASWVSPERAASEVVVRGGYKALSGKIDVLLLASGTDPTILRTGLAAFPDVNRVDYFDASSAIPTLGYLSQYDVVVVMSNNFFANASQTGNILADYVDAGGKVIEAVASFATGGGWELAGRFVTGGYEPFVHGPAEMFAHSLGSFDATHLIMQGVTALTDALPAGVGLKPQAVWVASWNNGKPLVATQGGNVVGINIYALDDGVFTGDVVLLFHNAVVWLVGQGVGGFSLTNVPSLPAVVPPLGSIDFNVVFEPNNVQQYSASVTITSNDADEPQVTVGLSGTGIPDYMEVTPDANFPFSGHPGGPFLPSYTYYYLKNLGPAQIDWMLTCPDWLNANITSGTIIPLETVKISVTPNALARSKPRGIYTGQLVFKNLTTTAEHDRNVSLNIYTDPKIWFTPGSVDANVCYGGSMDKILTIGNGGDGLLTFTLSGKQTGFTPVSMPVTIAGEPAIETQKDVAALAPPKHSFTALAGNKDFAEGQILVRFAPQPGRTWPGLAEKNSILANAGNGKLAAARVTKEYSIVRGLSLVKLPGDVAVKDVLVTLNNTPGVLYAEPDYKLKAMSAPQIVPNDPRFSELWGLNNTGQSGGAPDADIDAPEAWDIATGTNEIIVAVIDTGVDYTHPDLASNMWVNTAELNGITGVDDDGNGYIDDIYGYDFCNNDGDPMDDHYHGTHCAGTIGAIGNNGQGVAGVCWNVKIMALKFLDASGSGYTDDAIECVQYAVLMGAKLSSNSWGGGSYSQALKDAIDAAGNANQLFIAAAGNDYGNNNDINPAYPASYTSENIIAVMATDKYDSMSGFSNYGPTSVDIGAPGTDILSCQPGSNYQYLSGTSMATPHVSGAAALIWSVYPSMSYQEVKNILLQTVDEIPSLSGKCVSEGRLNLFNAVNEVGVFWMEFLPSSGSVDGGQTNNVTVRFHGDVPVGNYQGLITITSNDPYTKDVNIPVTMTVKPIDYFTELFGSGDNDLDNHTLTLVPDNSVQFYTACLEDASGFPVDPAGGTVLTLNDDDYYEVQLQGSVVSLYGTSYDALYIGSNGYITFVSGDTHYFEQFSDHFALPRIAALFDDLNPAAGGTISYKQLADRIAVTFENVPEFSLNTDNTFQIEIFFDGRIRITWLGIDAHDGIAGLSAGNGLPDYFVERDISKYGPCLCFNSPDLDHDGNADWFDIVLFADHWLDIGCGPANLCCGGCDFKGNGSVNFDDFDYIADSWLSVP